MSPIFMSPIFILTRDYREAQRIARRYELSPYDWRYLSDDHSLRGTRHAHVIATPCWRDRPSLSSLLSIGRAMEWAEANVAWVECQ